MSLLKDIFGESAPGDAGRWLNSARVVDGIVRHFFANFLRDLGEHGFMDRLGFECARMNGLFLGSGPDGGFERGSWNCPEHLGSYLLTTLSIDGETRNAVRDAFMVYANRLVDLIERMPDGADDAALKAGIDKLVGELRSALLGIPETI